MLLEVTRERPAVLPADRATLLIEHAAELVTLGWSFGDGARGGLWQGDPGLIHDGSIAIGGDGRVLAVGPAARVRDVGRPEPGVDEEQPVGTLDEQAVGDHGPGQQAAAEGAERVHRGAVEVVDRHEAILPGRGRARPRLVQWHRTDSFHPKGWAGWLELQGSDRSREQAS